MKKRNLFVATALMLVSPLFYACSDDKDEPETTKPSQTVSVVGQWNAANATNMYDESFTINSNGTIYYELGDYRETGGIEEIEILANGTYTVSGDNLKVNYTKVSVYCSNGKHSYNGFNDKESRQIIYKIGASGSGAINLVNSKGEKLVLKP